jgi:hypothetical protein
LRLKKPNGWFPTGDNFLQAMTQLSCGAFNLFVFLRLNADRRTAAYTVSRHSLASAIGKAMPATEEYITELKTKGFCSVRPSVSTMPEPVFGSTRSIDHIKVPTVVPRKKVRVTTSMLFDICFSAWDPLTDALARGKQAKPATLKIAVSL